MKCPSTTLAHMPPGRPHRCVIKAVHRRSRGTYGAQRIHAELTMEFGIRCGRKRVARLMRSAAIEGVDRT
jgi:HTH-like domain